MSASKITRVRPLSDRRIRGPEDVAAETDAFADALTFLGPMGFKVRRLRYRAKDRLRPVETLALDKGRTRLVLHFEDRGWEPDLLLRWRILGLPIFELSVGVLWGLTHGGYLTDGLEALPDAEQRQAIIDRLAGFIRTEPRLCSGKTGDFMALRRDLQAS